MVSCLICSSPFRHLSSLVDIFSLSWVTPWWNVHNDAIFCSQNQVRLKIFVVLYDVLRGNTKFKPVLRKKNNIKKKNATICNCNC